MKYFLLMIFLVTLPFGKGGGWASFAQIKPVVKKADVYYDNYEYSKAIPLYRKAAHKSDEALRKLADCYRILKNYPQAELFYGKLAAKNPSDPMVYYYYGEALLNNEKYDEAKKQFAFYSSLNPEDKRGTLYAKACDDIKELSVKPALYKVWNLGEVNSAVSDFCPAFYKNGLVFSSERIRDLMSRSENNWTGNPYLSLIYANAERKKDTVLYTNANLFSQKFHGDGHYGPACFSSDFSEIYFTKVSNTVTKKGVVSVPKIYWSKQGSGWNRPKALPFVSNEYSTGHPSISKDGQYLFFASNMTGGYGGTDIWVSRREGDAWGTPQNLGTEINTPGDESFPYISSSASGRLYFSSNGHSGFGGLDIFSAVQKDGKWSHVSNMMPPVNSTADDFGIVFKDDNSGYFSSNRSGGKGSDDLYGFALSGLITSFAGKILLSNKTDDGAPNIKVFLLTENGTVLQTTTTDGSGFFKFDNLLSDQNYTVRIDETDPSLVNQKKFYLADTKNRIVRMIVKGGGSIFIFENLPPDLTKLSMLVEDDDELKNFSIAGNLYAGDERAPIENTKVNLVNDKGEVLQSTTTNAFGSFVFTNLPPEQNLIITLDAADPLLASQKIYFTNKSGKEIAMSERGEFKFQILATDKSTLSLLTVEDSQLLIDLKGTLFADKAGKNRIVNSPINLVDEKGNVVGNSKTDAFGNFTFVNLPADKNYMVRLQEDDPGIDKKDVFLADAKGRIVASLKSAEGKFFRYTLLPMEEKSLTYVYFDDPWLKVAKIQAEAKKDSMLTIIENIYYEYEKWDILSEATVTLNKVVDVLKKNPDITIDLIAHTDSRGTDDFNMSLSQKRAQTAVDYIFSKGIEKSRMGGKGLGETQLVNRCKDGVECSEEEHAQNRRTEFKVKKK